MALRDYHLILGVSRTETARGIQNTFRELVKQLHPDRVGPQGTAAFQDLIEAYRVLSDPERRTAYRHHLLQTEIAAQRAPVPRRGWDWPRMCGNRPAASRSPRRLAGKIDVVARRRCELDRGGLPLDLCPHEFDQRLRAKDLDCPLDVVGQHMQAHFRSDARQGSRQEVRRPHPRL